MIERVLTLGLSKKHLKRYGASCLVCPFCQFSVHADDSVVLLFFLWNLTYLALTTGIAAIVWWIVINVVVDRPIGVTRYGRVIVHEDKN